MAFTFLDNPVGKIAGQPYYPTKWDPIKGVLTDNPNVPGYTLAGKLKAARPIYAASIDATQSPTPATTAPGLPSIFSAQPIAAPTAAGPSPVYPLNVPTGAGVSTISAPKSSNVSAAVNPMFTDLNALKESVNKTLADFKTKFPEWLTGQEKTAQVENAATSGLFTGEAQARSDANVADFLAQANAANAKSIADVQRLTSRSALASDASGYSSARDRGRFATIADINAKAGRDAAVAKMSADQWLTQLQQQMAGASSARNRLAIGDSLMPATVETQAFENILRQLAALSGVEQNNLLTGLVGPGGYVGDSFGQLQSFKLADLQRMFQEQVAVDNSNLNWTNLNQRAALQPSIERTSANNAVTAMAERDSFHDSMLTKMPKRGSA